MILQGHVLDVLKTLPGDSVDCCITSPPYWGLRDYKIEPQVWDAVEGCEHEWGEETTPARNETKHSDSVHKDGYTDAFRNSKEWVDHKVDASPSGGSFCLRCGAWRGSLGLEPTPTLFVKHIVDIFREVRRVLKPSGVCFVNLGDSYTSGNRTHRRDPDSKNIPALQNFERIETPPGLKPKDLCGIPWHVAFALQADGWYLRSDIIWSKPNPMPESVMDRPTKSHEYIFLLTKSARYFWNQEAIKEKCEQKNIGRRRGTDGKVPANATDFLRTRAGLKDGQGRSYATRNPRSVWVADEETGYTKYYTECGDNLTEQNKGETLFRTIPWNAGLCEFKVVVDSLDEKLWAWWLDFFVTKVGKADAEFTAKDRRNLARFRVLQKGIPKDVIEIATEPTPEAHFATFPQELVRRCILAGTSERGCCPKCGKPWVPVVEKGGIASVGGKGQAHFERRLDHRTAKDTDSQMVQHEHTVTGWRPTCTCGEEKTVPAVVCDIFLGSGTTGIVAENLYRKWVGIELNPEYIEIAKKRLKSKANVDQVNFLRGE